MFCFEEWLSRSMGTCLDLCYLWSSKTMPRFSFVCSHLEIALNLMSIAQQREPSRNTTDPAGSLRLRGATLWALARPRGAHRAISEQLGRVPRSRLGGAQGVWFPPKVPHNNQNPKMSERERYAIRPVVAQVMSSSVCLQLVCV